MSRTHEQRKRRRVLLLLGVYYPGIHRGIARYAREANWTIDNTYAHNSGLVPTWWHGDGMITLITHPQDHAAFRSFPPMPMVDLSKGWISHDMPARLRSAGRGRARVLYDNVAIGRLAAEHFIERGFRHVAFFNFGQSWMETERIPSYRRTVEEAGAQYHEIPYYRHFVINKHGGTADEKPAFQELVNILRQLPKPLAVHACTDDFGVRVLLACSEAGLSVPEEVAVLGSHNELLVCDCAPVPLSSVDTDMERQGYEAARLLDRLMDGKSPPKEPVLISPKGVVTRQSTEILAVSHLPTARALRFIWEHYHQPIGSSDIAAAAGISRRGLDHAFRLHLQRSVTEEVTRRRVEHARKLLETTDLKAYEIADKCGFSGLVYFSRVFKQIVGISPRVYRQQHPKD